MSILDIIIETYPELSDGSQFGVGGSIILQDDSDGQGAFIAQWDYKKPIPKNLKLGK